MQHKHLSLTVSRAMLHGMHANVQLPYIGMP
jgi:hypothetical protein